MVELNVFNLQLLHFCVHLLEDVLLAVCVSVCRYVLQLLSVQTSETRVV